MIARTAFDVLVPSKYYSVLCRIHPLMQRLVHTILDKLTEFDVRLIVFGSSVTYDCNSFSDLDIAISSKTLSADDLCKVHWIISDASVGICDCDVVQYDTLGPNDRLKEEIDTKGVVIKE